MARWIEASANDRECPEGFLPTRKALAERYGVSESTIQKALRHLAQKGVIRCTRGRQAQICAVARETAPPPPSGSSADYIADQIEREILNGILKAGDPLPKIDYFVKVYRVSSHTVIAAFRLLTRKGVIHKHGRRHIAGIPVGKNAAKIAGGSATPYVIFALLVDSRTWLTLQAPRTTQFVYSFLNELERRHIQLQPVYLDYPRAWENTVNGPEAIISRAEHLGTRYLGTIIPLRSTILTPDDSLIEKLLKLDRPVVWFDAIDEPDVHHPRHKRFYRCRFSEERAAYPAVEALATLGHRFIGYSYNEAIDWQKRRSLLLESLAPRFGIQIHRYPITPSDFRGRFRTFGSLLELFEKEGKPELAEKIAGFRSELPDWEKRLAPLRTESNAISDFDLFMMISNKGFGTLKPYFEELATIFNIAVYGRQFLHMDCQGLTAGVLPSDECAKRPLSCLNMLDVSIPERLSLLTFDNHDPRRIIPISSVDFGFGSLGYWAFHAIAGDITLPVDRHGTIWAQPFINDKGSLGAPRHSTMLSPKSRRLLQMVAEAT